MPTVNRRILSMLLKVKVFWSLRAVANLVALLSARVTRAFLALHTFRRKMPFLLASPTAQLLRLCELISIVYLPNVATFEILFIFAVINLLWSRYNMTKYLQEIFFGRKGRRYRKGLFFIIHGNFFY